MRNKKRYFIGIILMGIFFFGMLGINYPGNNDLISEKFFQSAIAAGDTGGLVPCGHGSDVSNRCTLCDLFVGISRIVAWGRNILVAVALTALTIGGIMYIVSAGNQQMMESAKNVLKQSLAGVAIVLGAWLIINTIMWLIVVKGDMGVGAGNWWNFSCGGEVSQGEGASDDADTEGYYRSLLEENNISINHNACEDGQVSGCTDIGGLRDNTLQGVISLAESSNSHITITGGSEGGHADGAYSHANGYKIDIRTDDTINNYITNNYQNIGVRSDGAVVYKEDNNYYAREGDHWDVCYDCQSPI